MIDVAKRAIKDITRLTQPSRETLAWMAAHPGRAMLPGPWRDADPDIELLPREIAQMLNLGDGDGQAGHSFLKNMGVPAQADGRRHTTIGNLEAYLLSRTLISQPTPRNSLKPHEYLFLMPMNWCHRTRAEFHSIVEVVSDQQISDFISGRAGTQSAFERFGFVEDDALPLRWPPAMTAVQIARKVFDDAAI